MIVSTRLRLVFIHIQKTAGTSIEAALRELDPAIGPSLYDGLRHIPASQFRHRLAPEFWAAAFKFAFVRNPWDRLVSWHCMILQNPPGNPFQQAVRDRYPDFADFIRCEDDPALEKTRQNQADFLLDEDGRMLVDFVGRYENLAQDFARLGLPGGGRLPRLNASRHGDYRRYYTGGLQEIVRQRFARDCAQFGYAFE